MISLYENTILYLNVDFGIYVMAHVKLRKNLITSYFKYLKNLS